LIHLVLAEYSAFGLNLGTFQRGGVPMVVSVEDPPKGDGMPMKIFLQRTKLRDVGRANVVLDVSALSGHFRRK